MSSRKPRFKLEEKVDVQGFFHNYRLQWYIGTIYKISRKERDGFYGPIVSYEYRVRIDPPAPKPGDYPRTHVVNVKKAESALHKLHTHTPIHNYLYESQGKVCHESNKRSTASCAQCKKLCCAVCNLCKIENQRYCGQCTPKVEQKRTAKAVATTVAEFYSEDPFNEQLEHFIDKLSTVIASYSIGFEFECCRITASNIKCTNSISFDNRFHLAFNQDMEHSEIYKYFIQREFHETHHKVVDYPFVQVDGKIMQIFCSECTAIHFADNEDGYYRHRNECKASLCKNRTYSTHCYNHPLCFLCQKWPNTKFKRVCRSCHNRYCSECGLESKYLCKICESSEEYGRYHTLLVETISEIISYDVCRIIAMYCSGFATLCCNKHCENTININSKSEWNNHVNSEGQKVYRYGINKKFLLPFYKTYNLFGQVGRIFCAECTANKLMKCKLVYKHSSCGIIKDTEEMCKLHTFCGAGGTRYSRAHDGQYYLTKRCDLQRQSVAVADLPYYYRHRHRNRRYRYRYRDFEESESEDDEDENGTFELMQCTHCCDAREANRYGAYSDYYYYSMSDDDDEPFLDAIRRRYSYSYRGYYPYYRNSEQSNLFCMYQYQMEEGTVMYLPKTKTYFGSKDEHKNRRHLYKDVRFAAQKKKDDKAGILRSKKHKKRKSYFEKKKDRKSNKKMKEKFKRRYQLSLQF